MVRLSATILAVTLAAGPALAFSYEYERRSDLDSNLYEREFVDDQEMFVSRQDMEDLYGREVFDHLEAREPGFGGQALSSRREYFDDLDAREPGFASIGTKAFQMGMKYAPKVLNKLPSFHRHRAASSNPPPEYYGREFFEDLEAREDELHSREFEDLLEARARGGVSLRTVATGARAAHKFAGNHQDTLISGFGAAASVANAYSAFRGSRMPMPDYGYRRELHEELFERDLDAEELLEREYDLLDERDNIDDLD